MVQLLPDLERNSVRRGFKILPSFIVMNFVEREWSMCSVNWISRGPEAWVQMRSTSTVWRPSMVKDIKTLALRKKMLEKLQVKWSFWRLHGLKATNKPAVSFDSSDRDFGINSSSSRRFEVQSTANTPKKLLYWQCNNNLQLVLCKWRTCQRRVESFSWELYVKRKHLGTVKINVFNICLQYKLS